MSEGGHSVRHVSTYRKRTWNWRHAQTIDEVSDAAVWAKNSATIDFAPNRSVLYYISLCAQRHILKGWRFQSDSCDDNAQRIRDEDVPFLVRISWKMSIFGFCAYMQFTFIRSIFNSDRLIKNRPSLTFQWVNRWVWRCGFVKDELYLGLSVYF